MTKVSAMVLAGGKGTRMDILCRAKAKPALPFAGKFRVIDFTLSNCIHSEIENIAVLVDYQRQQLAGYLKRSCFVDLPRSLDILGPRLESYRGTADAVFQNLDHVARTGARLVLVLAGDHVYRMDYRKMIAFHEEAGADVTVGVISVPASESHRFGMVTRDSNGRIVEFVEKPRVSGTSLASMGIYVFDYRKLAERLAMDATDPRSLHDFGHSILPRIVHQNKVFAYEFSGYWQDIGTVSAYYDANMELLREKPFLCLNGNWPVLHKEGDLAPASVTGQGTVKHSLVSPGCHIAGLVENSVLSPGVVVEPQAVVRNSIVMTGCVIGRHSVVDRSILDEEVNVGKSCYIGFGEAANKESRGITVVGRSATVPPFTAIDRDCKVLPHVGPSDFTSKVVASGTVVSAAGIAG